MAKQKLRLNPACGKLELTSDPDVSDKAKKVIEVYSCDSGANVGDVVHESLTTDNYVEVSTNNTDIAPSVGVIISKPTATTAEVLHMGKVSGFSGLTKGKKVFLSTLGTISSVVATTGYLQCMGYALSASEVYIKPSMERVKRI